MPSALRTDTYLNDDIYLEGSFSEVGIAEARIGSHGTPQTHELAIGADTGGPFDAGQTADFAWESDEEYGCELVYDPQADTPEGKRARMTLTVGQTNVTWTQEEEGSDPRLNVLAVRLRALKAESSIEVTDIRITPAGAQNGVIEPPTDHVSAEGADGLKSLVILGASLLNGFEMTFSLKMVFEDDGPNKPMLSLDPLLPSPPPDQTTEYVYGVGPSDGSKLHSLDLLRRIKYPDRTTGQPSGSATDQEAFTYNALGQKLTSSDQNGNVHGFAYYVPGRSTQGDQGRTTFSR